MSPGECSRVLWSLAVMNTLHTDDLGYVLLYTVLDHNRARTHDEATMSQLHQVFVAIDQMTVVSPWTTRLRELVDQHREHADQCALHFKANSLKLGKGDAQGSDNSDVLADRVVRVLRDVAPSARQDVTLGRECGHYSVDAFVDDLGLAIEVDGPYNYTFGLDR